MGLAILLFSTHAVAFWLGVVLNERLATQTPASRFRSPPSPQNNEIITQRERQLIAQRESMKREHEDDDNPPGSL